MSTSKALGTLLGQKLFRADWLLDTFIDRRRTICSKEVVIELNDIIHGDLDWKFEELAKKCREENDHATMD